jgi:hypothetical protein
MKSLWIANGVTLTVLIVLSAFVVYSHVEDVEMRTAIARNVRNLPPHVIPFYRHGGRRNHVR